MDKNYLDIEWLKLNHEMIHYFGLGFIQLKLNSQTRMHFYAPELPPIVSREDIHNHRYDFKSQIIKGVFKQEIFCVTNGDDHELSKESCKSGVEVESDIRLCGVQLCSSHTYKEGSEYTINHNTFHRVESNCAITLLDRGNYQKEYAEIVRPLGLKSVCPFSKKIDEKDLWCIVEKMLKG